MKHLFQFVGVLVAVLLAVPPAIAEGLCLLTPNQPSTMECCSGLDQIGSPVAIPPVSIAQNCSESCCSVAPQTPSLPTVSDKFKADPSSVSAGYAIASVSVAKPRDLALRTTGLTSDLPVLLRTFRI